MSRGLSCWLVSLVGVVAGALQALSMGLPQHLGPSGVLQWCAMLLLAFAVNQALASPRRVAALAYVFQCSALMGTVWWIFIALHVYGEMPLALSLLGLVLLCAGLSLYWAVFAALYAGLMALGGQRQTRWGWLSDALQALGYGACWTLSELARGVWFTGFPWGSSGYAHTNTWLGQLASWVGVYGLGWLSASLAMLCVLWLTPARLGAARERAGRAASVRLSGVRVVLDRGLSMSLGWVLVCVMVLSLSGWPVSWVRTNGPSRPVLMDPSASSRSQGEPTWKVTLLQGNVPMASQFTHAREEGGVWYRAQMARDHSDLVITPETAFAKPPQAYEAQFFPSLVTLLLAQHRLALIGMPLVDNRGYTNSAVGVGVGVSATDVYRYDKSHLVPFGEFVPPLFQWFTDHLSNPLGFFRHGDEAQASWSILGERIAPNICYEDLFGEELAQRFVQEALSPTILVNMSNIAWFGDTVVVDQHIEISRMRTLELHRPMLRSTNAGATMVIDENARVVAALPRFTQGVLTARVAGVHEGVTFYAWWAGRFGLWPLWLSCTTVLLLLGGYRRRQRGRQSRSRA